VGGLGGGGGVVWGGGGGGGGWGVGGFGGGGVRRDIERIVHCRFDCKKLPTSS